MQLDLCFGYTQDASSGNAEIGCVIVFEIFRRNGDCTLYVAVKSQRSIQKNDGVGIYFI
jgi:hypothetical protein